MNQSMNELLARFPLLGTLQPGAVQRHEVSLPGSALAGEHWPVVSIAGVRPGPVVFINAGVHGGEYPAIETVIRLGLELKANSLSGLVVLMPVVNLPSFWERSMFVGPVDGKNLNRVFPGSPDGSYSEQLAHALMEEFIVRADVYLDLHGGDMVEDLEPFSICQGGDSSVARRSEELARAFGLPNLLVVDRPVQPGVGTMSYAAASTRGIPAFIAEAGGIGLLQPEAVDQLLAGVYRLLNYLGMTEVPVSEPEEPRLYSSFEWLYSTNAGMFYPSVVVGEQIGQGQILGTIGSLFGDVLEMIQSPVSGRVIFTTTSPAVKQNGLLMGIGANSE